MSAWASSILPIRGFIVPPRMSQLSSRLLIQPDDSR
jgi:hypothetical protein